MVCVLMTIILLAAVHVANAADVSMKQFITYPGCTSGMVTGSASIATISTSSGLECSALCAHRDDCQSVNICEGPGYNTCELLDTRNGGCVGLVQKSDCRYMEKHVQDHSPCYNGGTWIYAQPCVCLPGWAGYYCQRIVRDCKEGKNSGQTGNRLSTIQPIKCPHTFEAFCIFEWGQMYFLRRNHPFSDVSVCEGNILEPNMDWTGFSSQFGDVRCDYFLGLQQLWYVLRQGSYNLHIYLQYYENQTDLKPTPANIYYWNVRLGSDSEGYPIQYSSYTAVDIAEDGLMLGDDTPARFCTRDRDCGTCARDRGVGWWYSPNCTNFPLTLKNGTVLWPINGQVRTLSLAVMQFSPTGYNW
ncbi:fibrinogen-like protein 1 [Haliotis rubra]|uniref:fibrinogen-like protein 1 n=1 Tax=Haliotis rubra TaxID=36100 RepID=UPI001EE5D6B1|nr:fibrinogen-like protein 1 [Haliotis rubra]